MRLLCGLAVQPVPRQSEIQFQNLEADGILFESMFVLRQFSGIYRPDSGLVISI